MTHRGGRPFLVFGPACTRGLTIHSSLGEHEQPKRRTVTKRCQTYSVTAQHPTVENPTVWTPTAQKYNHHPPPLVPIPHPGQPRIALSKKNHQRSVFCSGPSPPPWPAAHRYIPAHIDQSLPAATTPPPPHPHLTPVPLAKHHRNTTHIHPPTHSRPRK